MNTKKIQSILTIAILCTLSLGASAQNWMQMTDVEILNLGDEQTYGYIKNTERTPLNGKIRLINGTEAEYTDAQFQKGIATGKWEYYKKGKLRSSYSYVNGYKEGEYLNLGPDGSIWEKGEYLQGQKIGTWEKFSATGNKQQTEIYDNNGLIKRKIYYANGNIETEGNYKNGKEHGPKRRFRLDGTMKSEANYIDGKQAGTQIQHFTSNAHNYVVTSNYLDGRLDGEYIEIYAENENLKTKGTYLKGQKNGKWLFYDLKGKPTAEVVYNNGVEESTKVINQIAEKQTSPKTKNTRTGNNQTPQTPQTPPTRPQTGFQFSTNTLK